MLTNRLMCDYKNSSLILMYRCVNLMTIVKALGKNLQKYEIRHRRIFKKKFIILKKTPNKIKLPQMSKKFPNNPNLCLGYQPPFVDN